MLNLKKLTGFSDNWPSKCSAQCGTTRSDRFLSGEDIMSTTTTPQTTQQQTEGHGGMVVPFDQINEPGCYICQWSGHLLRVPPDGVAPGRSPLVNMIGFDPLYVIKISDNPYIPVTKARMLAANFDLGVNF
jgi:hypothetical protein